VELSAEEMLRHPRVVKTATAAELSWRLGRQVFLSEDLDALHKEAEAKEKAELFFPAQSPAKRQKVA